MDRKLSERIQELCALIATEQDRSKFLRLCEELNSLLSRERSPLSDKITNGPPTD